MKGDGTMQKTSNRNLALLLGGQFVSQIGDKFYALALAFWVLQTTGSPARMGVVLFCSMVPSIVLGFFIGGFIDKYDRKTILVVSDVVRGLAILAVVAVYYTGSLSLAAIAAAQILLSIASAFFNPTVLSVVPQIVPGEKLVKANSTSQFLSGAANIIGPILGGLAVSFFGYAFVFVFNALSFFISALCEGLMAVPPVPKSPVEKLHMHEKIAQGYSYIFSQGKIVVLLGVVAVVHFFVGSVQVIMPVLAKALAGNGAQNLGYIETAFGFGAVAAALLLRALKLRGREGLGMFGGIAGLGLVMTAVGVLISLGMLSVLPFLPAFFLLSGAVIIVSTSYTVLLQSTVDNAMAGRVFGIIGSVGNFTLPVSILVFGYLLNTLSTGAITLFCGAVILLICAALALMYRAKKIPIPERGEGI